MDNSIQEAFENIKAKNLLLRIPKPEDLHTVLSIEEDLDTSKYHPAGRMKDLNEAEETLREWRNNCFTDGYGYWAIAFPSSSEIIGFGGIRRNGKG